MGGLTDRLLWQIYWFLFEWNLNAVKWKAVIIGAIIGNAVRLLNDELAEVFDVERPTAYRWLCDLEDEGESPGMKDFF